MANTLVVHKNHLPQSQKIHRAAQYVRMSTDYQQYSIENQAVVIATYAELHKFTIVRTYRDEGESGLKIENRQCCEHLLPSGQVAQVRRSSTALDAAPRAMAQGMGSCLKAG
jgi:hypothetical protein